MLDNKNILSEKKKIWIWNVTLILHCDVLNITLWSALKLLLYVTLFTLQLTVGVPGQTSSLDPAWRPEGQDAADPTQNQQQ